MYFLVTVTQRIYYTHFLILTHPNQVDDTITIQTFMELTTRKKIIIINENI